MNPILDYVRNIVVNVIKIKVDQVYNGIVLAGGLYLLIDDTIMLIFDLSNKIPPEVKLTFNRESLIEDRVECNPIIFKDIENKVHYYASFSNEINAYWSNYDLREDPLFESMLQNKASDGTSFYFIDRYGKKQFIPVSKSLFSLNKGDTISGYVNCIDDITDLCTFHIFRKKAKISYTLLFRIINV